MFQSPKINSFSKNKGNVRTSGVLFGGAGHLGYQIFRGPGAKSWHYAAKLRTLSVSTYYLCGSALTGTTDNLSEMWPIKLKDFCLFLHHQYQSYTILHGPLILPKGFNKLS